ncbi:ABC transporter ATP-binding protein [Oceanicola sp. 502str15]|uniref:ABC transporter ATP-binding protein n=1 Tax=Oceanicola sp. 502str15 TaxID=2696061 RepID=UPI002094D222|nr:ABC transporter ATP-binding protein [Oceanicola sp. 502str15]MCO6385302.1 ATP-binding cassette domain-containing protein [Oceanicola sp. 502str15]
MSQSILEVTGLTKRFGGFLAVDNVDLSIKDGSIHALIGPNGAGKTTCFNLLTGTIPPTGGQIRFRGKDITGYGAAKVARSGIVRSFQISSVFGGFTVIDNLRLALQQRRRHNFDFWRSDKVLKRYDDRAEELIGEVGLNGYMDRVANTLSYGQKRGLEIATTLALDPDLLLLDEPTSGMGREDIGRLVELLKRIRKGRTILMVEHNLPVIEGLCDRVTVLARGSVLAEGGYAEVASDQNVREAYLGAADA